MLPDDIEDIVATVHRLKARVGEHGAIITSGGIGPTHDDVRTAVLSTLWGPMQRSGALGKGGGTRVTDG